MEKEQYTIWDFDSESPDEELWEPRDIWINLNEEKIASFKEDGRIEYKSVQKINSSGLSEYYSMFSNTTSGGVLVYGVNNNGDIEGCAGLSSNQLNKLEKLHVQFCPQAKPETRRILVNQDKDFILAVFIPYVGQLVENHKGDAFIRYGDSKHKMTDEEKQDFRSTRQQGTWENDISIQKYPDEFDPSCIAEICDEFRKREKKPDWTNEEVLVDRLLLRKVRGGHQATNALALLAAHSPRLTNPGARVKLQRFKGIEQGEGDSFAPIRDTYIEGTIVEILRKSPSIIEPLIYDVTWLNKDGKFQTTPEYPFHAWFEALVNALVHRSYSYSGSEVSVRFFSDRLEIESPGSFMPPVNEKNVFDQRASRNANLCDALRYIGFTRMSREGTRRMRESMKRVNLPEPEFTQETTNGVSVLVTLRNDIMSRERTSDMGVAKYCGTDIWKTLQDHEITIIGHVFRNRRIHVNEAANLTGRTWNTSKKDLRKLTEKGLLKFIEPEYPRDSRSCYEIVHERLREGAKTDLSARSAGLKARRTMEGESVRRTRLGGD